MLCCHRVHREEHARQMWSELEELIQAHAGTSSGHQQIFDILCHLKPSHTDTTSSNKKKRSMNDRCDNSNATDGSTDSGTASLSNRPDSSLLMKKSRTNGPSYNFKGLLDRFFTCGIYRLVLIDDSIKFSESVIANYVGQSD